MQVQGHARARSGSPEHKHNVMQHMLLGSSSMPQWNELLTATVPSQLGAQKEFEADAVWKRHECLESYRKMLRRTYDAQSKRAHVHCTNEGLCPFGRVRENDDHHRS